MPKKNVWSWLLVISPLVLFGIIFFSINNNASASEFRPDYRTVIMNGNLFGAVSTTAITASGTIYIAQIEFGQANTSPNYVYCSSNVIARSAINSSVMVGDDPFKMQFACNSEVDVIMGTNIQDLTYITYSYQAPSDSTGGGEGSSNPTMATSTLLSNYFSSQCEAISNGSTVCYTPILSLIGYLILIALLGIIAKYIIKLFYLK